MGFGDLARTALDEARRVYKELVELSAVVDVINERIKELREDLHNRHSGFEARLAQQQQAFEGRLAQQQQAFENRLQQLATALEERCSAANSRSESAMVQRLDQMQSRVEDAKALANDAQAMIKALGAEAVGLILEARGRDGALARLVPGERPPPKGEPPQ